MLGIVLLYVGIVLISNGCYGLLGIEDKSNVVMNLFTGGLGLVLNIIAIGIGVARGGRRLVVLRKRHRPAVRVYLPLYRPQHHLRLRQAPLWHLQSLCCHQHHPGWSPVHYAGLQRQLDLRTHLVGVGHPVAHRLHRDKPQEAAGQVRGVPGRCRGNCHGLDSRFPHARGHVAGVASPCSGAGGRPALVSRLALPERLGRVQSKGRKRERPCNCPSVSRKR